MKTINEIINEAWLAGYKEGYKTNFQKPEEAKKNMANNYTTEVVNKNDLLPDVSNRRELLFAFADYLRKETNVGFIAPVTIHTFLSKQ